MILWLQRALLFVGQFDKRQAAPAPEGVESWWLETEAGPVEAWFLPAAGETPAPVVIFAHGNGERIQDWPGMLAPYRELGLSVVLAEYRGYGSSAGRPSEAAIRDDLHQLIARVRADPRVDPSRIVYHGRSLGTGALATLLEDEPPRALIFESGFRSVSALAWENYRVPKLLIYESFDSESALASYGGHFLVMHGTADRLISPSHSRALHAAERPPGSPDPRLLLLEGGHNNMEHGPRYWSAIEATLRDSGVL